MTTFVFKNSTNETARVEYASKNASKTQGKRSRKLDARVLAGSINTAHLCLTAEQSAALDARQADVTEKIFSTSAQDQDAAHALLGSFKLQPSQLTEVGSRWSIRWSDKIGKNGGQHVLYQCNCGYQHTLNGAEKRHTPFPFTACLAHVEVTYWPTKDTVLRVRGLTEHNEACSQAEICAAPKIPLHPAVFEAALQQLRLGAALTDIQEQNRRMFLARAYRDQPPDVRESNFRWILQQSDMRTLYRQYGRLHGVNLNDRPEQNVQSWLDPASPTYHRALAEAVFHYSPRAEKGDRFKICIATPAMHEASWRYAHKSQLVLDGTFGLCDKRMLLFIAMGIDENGHGVPLAFFLFSAPTGNRQTSSGYDTAILAELLGAWRDTLGKRNDEQFEPLIAMTDTDTRERAALLQIWPNICLLLCRFHVRQSWRNHRSTHLKGDGAALDVLRDRMRRLESDLLETTQFADAIALIQAERRRLREARGSDRAAAAKASVHIDYLDNYWVKEDLWKSWSDFGRQHAASLLGRPVAAVVPTSNHLESFNRVLKKKHLRRWEHNGRRLRLDMLVVLLACRILPSIFEQRRLTELQTLAIRTRISALPGGAALLAEKQQAARCAALQPVAYYSVCEQRDAAAVQILYHKQLSFESWDTAGARFSCYSSMATTVDKAPVTYSILLCFNGLASCTCADFRKVGGACKHMRAALVRYKQIREEFLVKDKELPLVPFPCTEAEAREIVTHATAADLCPDSTVPIPDALHRAAIDIAEVFEHGEDIFESEDAADDGTAGSEDDDELDDTDTPAAAIVSEPDTDEYDFLPPTSAQRGLEQQSAARLEYHLGRLVPKLGDMLELAQSVREPGLALKELAAHAATAFASLAAEMSRVADVDKTTHPGEHRPPSCAPHTPLPHNRKRRRLDGDGDENKAPFRPLSVSPEPKQTRKNSYGTL